MYDNEGRLGRQTDRLSTDRIERELKEDLEYDK